MRINMFLGRRTKKMINSYEAYLKHPAGHILKMEDALHIYTKMAESVNMCQLEDKMYFWNDFLKRACAYTKIRNDWDI